MSIDRERIVAEFYEAFGQHDIEGMEANLAPEVDWTAADGRRERGRAGVQDVLAGRLAVGRRSASSRCRW